MTTAEAHLAVDLLVAQLHAVDEGELEGGGLPPGEARPAGVHLGHCQLRVHRDLRRLRRGGDRCGHKTQSIKKKKKTTTEYTPSRLLIFWK